jgi:hypothetical protein
MSANNYPRQSLSTIYHRVRLRRGLLFGIILLVALIAFELFNYSTTEYALSDLLGDLEFLGIRWATILAVAFCGIDFAGIARLHTPEEGGGQVNETWYLFGAWLLAATMNAMLTWWGVSLALVDHASQGSAVVDNQTLLRVVPIFVAVLVWLIRVLIIGTYSLAGTRLLTQREYRYNGSRNSAYVQQPGRAYNSRGLGAPAPSEMMAAPANSYRPAPKSAAPSEPAYTRQDPIYTPVQSAGPVRSSPFATNNSSLSSKPGSTPPRRT